MQSVHRSVLRDVYLGSLPAYAKQTTEVLLF